MDIDVIYNEDCIEVLKGLEDNSIDAIVTDPPYNLGFMNKKWDNTGVAFNLGLWEECLRVIKPGGNLLSFGGTRTYHRMACAIEDAGFEIRDCIMWVYGSGFPKSLDISKAIDKKAGAKREEIDYIAPDGKKRWGGNSFSIGEPPDGRGINKQTIPSTPEAKLWEGYGTGLKPSYEPIVLAMKPLDGTFVENCLKWGVGGLNIDGCRIPTDWGNDPTKRGWQGGNTSLNYDGGNVPIHPGAKPGHQRISHSNPQGRFPANFIHDGSQEVMELFPKTIQVDKRQRKVAYQSPGKHGIYGNYNGTDSTPAYNDSGSAARFFYCAKASKKERDAGLEGMLEQERIRQGLAGEHKNTFTRNIHPTVKPLALMEYLVKLVTRPGHLVLDPFLGSGTTGMACVKLGRHYIGCELDKGYYDIAIKRIEQVDK